MPGIDLNFVKETVERIGRKPAALIPILQALQEHYGWLPQEALERLAELSEIQPSAIAGVSTFHDMFRHKPAGKHIFQVCRGTACQVAGAERVEESLRRHLNIPPGADTDAALEFTVEQVACLGCCSLAPVVKMGGLRWWDTRPRRNLRPKSATISPGNRRPQRRNPPRKWDLRPRTARPKSASAWVPVAWPRAAICYFTPCAKARANAAARSPSSASAAWACAIARR